jgi:hypothetical protein
VPGPHPLDDPARLVGRWRLRRAIADARAGRAGRARGTLDLVPAPGGAIDWLERMDLEWDGRVLPATRAYRLVPGAGGWQVVFPDGTPFHAWRPGGTVIHPCADDRYEGVVAGDPARWTVTWRVRGPRKDLEIRSILTPGAPGGR